jgi:segregation and condensation protein A
MSEVLVALEGERYKDFVKLFDPAEGRIGVTVTFLAILELLKESLIDVIQAEPYGPIHVRAAQSNAKRKRATEDEQAAQEPSRNS